MDVSALLIELYGRIPPLAHRAVDGLAADDLAQPAVPGTNPIGWLVWHLTRVHDHHLAEILDQDQLWVTDGWADRFGLAAEPSNIGYGHSADDVATIRPDGPEVLVGYLDAVHARTIPMLAGLTADDLDRIVDRRWDPPVTLGVRLVSVADDCLQHVGQACYLRGQLGL